MNMQHRIYLSRNKARNFLGGYSSLSKAVLDKLKELFEDAGEPRIALFNNHRALFFDRRIAPTYFILIKVEDRFGLFTKVRQTDKTVAMIECFNGIWRVPPDTD